MSAILADGRRTARDTALIGAIGAIGASALVALGLFRPALALTLGTAVAIVSAVWLAGLVERLTAPRRGSAVRIDRRFGFKAALRYAFVGLFLWGAVRLLPAEVPWLLGGISTVVLALVAEEIGEARRERRRRAP